MEDKKGFFKGKAISMCIVSLLGELSETKETWTRVGKYAHSLKSVASYTGMGKNLFCFFMYKF